ncbi:hypothetical protein DAMA08_026250 [Martiniozyma asiatica (nom. inval.)]|nr:hypothetical protein DAMA08_026250 [Martiniozyma asiatica]
MTGIHGTPKTTFSVQIESPDQLKSISLQELSIYRKQIDDDLILLFEYLDKNLKADMNTNLVTPDGFPRNDIDVAQIRFCRAKILRLQNDYKWVSNELLEKMQIKFGK